MRAVFADTFYWVALTNPEDSRYREAIGLDNVLAGATIVTTDEIMQTMRKESIAEPLTNDRHFEQEGLSRNVSGFLQLCKTH